MSEVFTEYYQITGETAGKVRLLHLKNDEIYKEQLKVAKSFGATGFYLSKHFGKLKTLHFEGALPKGWKKSQLGEGAATPNLNTVAGKLAQSILDETPVLNTNQAFANEAGIGEIRYFDGRFIRFATVSVLSKPTVCVLASVPRMIGDSWQKPEGFIEIKASEYHQYFENQKGKNNDETCDL